MTEGDLFLQTYNLRCGCGRENTGRVSDEDVVHKSVRALSSTLPEITSKLLCKLSFGRYHKVTTISFVRLDSDLIESPIKNWKVDFIYVRVILTLYPL